MVSISSQLAEFSNAVRNSTIERLQLIPDGKENWRFSPGVMSSADIVYHLIETDEWLFKKIELKNLKSILGNSGTIEIQNRNDYLKLIDG